MIKFAAVGSLDYLRKGVKYLKDNGYNPEIVIEKSKEVNDSIENHLEEIKDKGIELLVCLAYPDILKKPVIDLFKKGCLNIHAGLPAYRGRHPVPWMLIDGLKEVPVSVHYMNEGIDTGDIITHDTVFIERDDDYKIVLEKILNVEGPLLLSALKQVETESAYRRKQHKQLFRYTKRRTPEDSRLNWDKSSYDIVNFINALVDPLPNAFSDSPSGRVEFKRAFRGKEVGVVLAETADGKYVISTSDGVVLVKTNRKLNIGEKLVNG